MTEDLQTLLRVNADRVRFDPVDLDAVTRAGARVVRRRRLATVGALALAGILSVVAINGSPDSDGDRVADQGTLPTDTVSWALGSVLHTSGATYDIGSAVHSYVRTTDGYVVVDGDGTARSLVDGTLREVGRAQGLRLVADPDDSVVAWADANERGVVVRLDLVTGRLSRYAAHGDPSVAAVDGTAIYGQDDRGTVLWSADTPGGDVVDLSQVEAAEDGTVVSNPHDGTMLVTRPDAAPVSIPAQGQQAFLSPGGRYVVIDADEPLVFDTTTGTRVHVDFDGFHETALEWLDDHTVALMVQERRAGPFELVACSVPDGRCRIDVADTGISYDQNEDPEGFAVPVGQRLD